TATRWTISTTIGWKMSDNPYGLSDAELAVLVEGQAATNAALAELARTIAARHRVELQEPDKTQPKKRSYRLSISNMSRDGIGGLAGDVEYPDGCIRRFRLGRDETGELEGEIEDVDPAEAPAPATEPAPEPSGAFADVFG